MTIPNVVLGELIDPVTFGNAVVDAVNEHETEIADRLPLTGGTLTGDLQVDGDVRVGFRIKSEFTRDNPTASGAPNVHLSDNGYFYKTTSTRGGPFAPSKLPRSEDVLVKAETATLPPEMETDGGGNILNTAEIEAHDTVQLFDVVTALLSEVKELRQRVAELEAA